MNQFTIPGGAAKDSYSCWQILSGKQTDINHSSRTSLVYHSDSGKLALRKGEWVLLDCKGSGGWSLPENDADANVTVQLYNLKTDRAQKKNVASLYPEKVKELKAELDLLRE